MKKQGAKTTRQKNPSERRTGKVSTREDVVEKVHLPGAGETELVPPGTPISSPSEGADGKDRPVVIKPDVQEDDERTTQDMPVYRDDPDRLRR